MYWENIGLLGHHEPEPKKEILKKLKLGVGKYSNLLIDSNDLSYFNKGVKKTVFRKGQKKIDYGD
jgi:hypothetical protein